MTSKELAKLAGVSLATVSRAFSPTARIKKSTRERIISAAREHNYQPNAMARALHSRTSRLTAIVVNTIANPSEAEKLDVLVQRLQDRRLMPIILCCAAIEDRLPLIRLASRYQVDHVVVFSDMFFSKDVFEIFAGLRPIMVTLEPDHHPDVSTIEIDGGAAADEIVQKLVCDGRLHFAYLGGRSSSWIDQRRQGWFAAALKRRGLQFEAFGRGNYTYDSGFKESIMLMRRHEIDALVCGNDVMAMGTCDAVRRVLGRKIPDDLAVVGQGGIAMAAWECHDLTTLAQDYVKLIDLIMELIDQDEDDQDGARKLSLSCTVRWGTTA